MNWTSTQHHAPGFASEEGQVLGFTFSEDGCEGTKIDEIEVEPELNGRGSPRTTARTTHTLQLQYRSRESREPSCEIGCCKPFSITDLGAHKTATRVVGMFSQQGARLLAGARSCSTYHGLLRRSNYGGSTLSQVLDKTRQVSASRPFRMHREAFQTGLGGLSRGRSSRQPYQRMRLSTAASSEPQKLTGTKLFLRQLAVALPYVSVSMGIGDLLCQYMESGEITSWGRSLYFAGVGLFVTGPVLFSFQMLLEHMVPGKSVPQILKKTALIACFSLVFTLPAIITSVTLSQPGKTLRDAIDKLKVELLPTFAASCMYWPIFNVLVFRFVQAQHRAIVNTFIATIWNIFLSYVANQDPENKASSPFTAIIGHLHSLFA